MASHMGVQTVATERNSNVEFFVQYILDEFGVLLAKNDCLQLIKLSGQSQYTSDIASDVWDHFLTGEQKNGRKLELWCQTTCYKGNGTGAPEPNKTYEVRETLVEGISIRKLFAENLNIDYRTIHFTVGDKRYTYQWFLDLKSSAYDKSIYIGEPGYDIFKDIALIFRSAFTEADKKKSLSDCVRDNTKLGAYIKKAISELNDWWFIEKHKKSGLADLQWGLVDENFNKNSDKWPDFEKLRGFNIKGKVNNVIFKEGYVSEDPLITKTAIKLLKKNPFLQTAIDITSNWESFVRQITKIGTQAYDLKNYIALLWTEPLPRRLVLRRLLLRVHTTESVSYIQDRDIKGITEHNIYSGEHNDAQVEIICDQLQKSFLSAGILIADDLRQIIIKNGKKIINQARWFEAKNGTQLKPSFDYVELALIDAGYTVNTPAVAGIRTIGFHSEITTENVNPYTNLKVVKNAQGVIVCILKAKFFRIQEFPRRCKEESFVGLSLKYQLNGSTFSKRFATPLIMFVDMAEDCVPPAYAIKRLISFGWEIVFSVEDLIKKISK